MRYSSCNLVPYEDYSNAAIDLYPPCADRLPQEIVHDVAIFYRTSPRHKLGIVQALQVKVAWPSININYQYFYF